jgi:hypothetical protein
MRDDLSEFDFCGKASLQTNCAAQISGNLGKDAESFTTPSGKNVTRFSIASRDARSRQVVAANYKLARLVGNSRESFQRGQCAI